VGLQEVLGPGKRLSRVSRRERVQRRLSWSCDSVVRVSCIVVRDSVVIECTCAINPITNLNPVCSHLTRDNIY
jgi:hypothetical protein